MRSNVVWRYGAKIDWECVYGVKTSVLVYVYCDKHRTNMYLLHRNDGMQGPVYDLRVVCSWAYGWFHAND